MQRKGEIRVRVVIEKVALRGFNGISLLSVAQSEPDEMKRKGFFISSSFSALCECTLYVCVRQFRMRTDGELVDNFRAIIANSF